MTPSRAPESFIPLDLVTRCFVRARAYPTWVVGAVSSIRAAVEPALGAVALGRAHTIRAAKPTGSPPRVERIFPVFIKAISFACSTNWECDDGQAEP